MITYKKSKNWNQVIAVFFSQAKLVAKASEFKKTKNKKKSQNCYFQSLSNPPSNSNG